MADKEFNEAEMKEVVGGKNPSVGIELFCTKPSTPDLACTGITVLGMCKNYVETADPNGKATPYTYPVLCTCKKGYFKDVPMNRSYQQ